MWDTKLSFMEWGPATSTYTSHPPAQPDSRYCWRCAGEYAGGIQRYSKFYGDMQRDVRWVSGVVLLRYAVSSQRFTKIFREMQRDVLVSIELFY